MLETLQEETNMIERYLEIFRLVIENEPIGIVQLSNETGYPHHKVRYSLRILEDEELIIPTGNGAETTAEASDYLDGVNTTLDDIQHQLASLQANNAEITTSESREE